MTENKSTITFLCTHTSHFISQQGARNREILAHVAMTAPQSGCKSKLKISCSTTFPRCTTEDFNYEDHLSTVSCSKNQLRLFELCTMEHYPTESSHQNTDHKGMALVSNNTCRLWSLNNVQLILRGVFKCAKKIPPTQLHNCHELEPLTHDRMDQCFLVYKKIRNLTNYLLCHFGMAI